MNIPKLQKTTDYKIFKKINSNREINKSHLRKLITGIERKNLLYLFPIVINKDNEVVDGQHRLKAAEELGLPVFYLVDNNITKADIAMVNSNRKAWAMRDYVEFYAGEGDKAFKNLKKLMEEYPKITTGTAVRLLDRYTMFYSAGGGMFSGNVKTGMLNDDCYAIAKEVAALCEKLHEKRDYAFSGFFMMDVKNAIIQSGSLASTAADIIWQKKHVLPAAADKMESHLGVLKDILGIQTGRSGCSKDEVEAFLERHKNRKAA